MAPRKQLWHPEEVKQRIQVSQLLNRLMEHVNSPVPIMDSTQVKAAQILLAKVLPDLKYMDVQHSGEIESTSREQREAAIAAALKAQEEDRLSKLN